MIDEANYKIKFDFLMKTYLEKGPKFIRENKESLKEFIDEYRNKGGKENSLAAKTLKLVLENLN